MRHAAAAGAYDEASAMIVANGPVWAQHGRPATVGAWLDLIPGSVLERDPQLAACAAWHARATGGDATTLRNRIRLAERPDARPWIGVAATQRAELLLLRAVEPYGDACASLRAARAASRGIPRSDPAIGRRGLAARRRRLLQIGRHDEARGPLRAAMRWSTRPEQALLHDGSLALLAAAEAHAGDPQRGAHLAERAAQLIVDHDLGPSSSIGYAYMGIADAFTTAGQPARAIPLARRAVELLDMAGPHVTHAYALLVLARALIADGEDSAALATLERLRDAIAGAGDVRYVARAAASLASTLSGRQPSPVEPLSVRELEVLRLLGSDMSQREIAAQLFISVNTVKTHVRSVLRKFRVGSRGAAVELAREAGLIGDYAPATTAAAAPRAGPLRRRRTGQWSPRRNGSSPACRADCRVVGSGQWPGPALDNSRWARGQSPPSSRGVRSRRGKGPQRGALDGRPRRLRGRLRVAAGRRCDDRGRRGGRG